MEINGEPMTSVQIEEINEKPTTTVTIEEINNKLKKKIIFWIIYITIALASSIPQIVMGVIQTHNASCLNCINCFVSPPIWLIVSGCIYGVGMIIAAGPTYYLWFNYNDFVENGNKLNKIIIFSINPLVGIGIIVWSGIGASIAVHWNGNDIDLICGEGVNIMIAIYFVYGIIILTCSLVGLLGLCLIFMFNLRD